MVQVAAPPMPGARSSSGRLLLALAIGALVALSLGIYGRVHDPTGRSLVTLFFSKTITLKVWLATAAVALAVLQAIGGLRMYGKPGRGPGPRWIWPAHRPTRRAAGGERAGPGPARRGGGRLRAATGGSGIRAADQRQAVHAAALGRTRAAAARPGPGRDRPDARAGRRPRGVRPVRVPGPRRGG